MLFYPSDDGMGVDDADVGVIVAALFSEADEFELVV